MNSCFFPLYEVERGKTRLTYNPEERNKKIAVADWLKMMGKTKHLSKPEYEETLKAFEEEVNRRWERLKAKHENPYL